MARVALTNEQKVALLSQDITKKCKKLLKAEGISQRQVAELVGCSQKEVSYELNHLVSLKVLTAIALLTNRGILNEKTNSTGYDSISTGLFD